jgi:short-subunit dehydrogenase
MLLRSTLGMRGRPSVRAWTCAAIATALAIDGLRRIVKRRVRFRVAGRNALVTGGSRGLGLEIARVLVDRGANVAILARSAAEIDRAVAELRRRSAKVRVVGIAADLSCGSEIAATIERVRAVLGPVDVLVNNAGLIEVGPLDTNTEEDFQTAMRVHCFGPLRLMLGLRDDMRRRGGGRIANIASIGGVVAIPHLLPYSTSKFALMGLSEAMRAELAAERIFVSTVAPSLMRAGSPVNAKFKGRPAEENAWFTLADSLPGLSMPASRTARVIVRALEDGTAHVVIGLPAKILAVAKGLFPNAAAAVTALAGFLLPRSHDKSVKNGHDVRLPPPRVMTAATLRMAADSNAP